jgi:hypothetical protein
MWSPTRGVPRVLRAATLGVVAFALALVAHVVAGGAVPGPVAMLFLAGLVALAAVLLTRARLSPIRVGVSLGAMQMVLHESFMWLSAPAGCLMTGASAPAGVPMGRGSMPVPLVECATGMAHMGMGMGSPFTATAMVGAHVVATAVMAALLAYGEKVLWFLAGRGRSPRCLGVGLPGLPALRLVSSGEPRMFGLRLACGGVGRRGPPSRGQLVIV